MGREAPPGGMCVLVLKRGYSFAFHPKQETSTSQIHRGSLNRPSFHSYGSWCSFHFLCPGSEPAGLCRGSCLTKAMPFDAETLQKKGQGIVERKVHRTSIKRSALKSLPFSVLATSQLSMHQFSHPEDTVPFPEIHCQMTSFT